MPKRIYAFAKELGMDSKELVALCEKVGIKNKGSALASLDDEEIQRIEKHLAQAKQPAEQSASTAPKPRVEAPVRTAPLTGRGGLGSKPPVIPTRRSSKAAQSSPPAAEQTAPSPAASEPPAPPATPTEPAEEAITAKADAAPAAATSESSAGSEPVRKPISRDDYVPPPSAVAKGRVRSLDMRRPKSDSDAKPAERKRPAKREPIIKVARVPTADLPPVPPTKKDEPAPQRPEIRFTKEDISGQKKGMKASLERLEEQNEREKERRRGMPSATAPGGLKGFKDAADKKRGRHREEDEDEREGKKRAASLAATRAERRKRGKDLLEEEERQPARSYKRIVRKGTNTAAPRKEKAVLELPCTVRSFSEAAGVPAGKVLATLMQMGQMLNINANLDVELAELLALELGVELEFKQPKSLEEAVIEELENMQDPPDKLVPRPPVITFLGHVDHGKTSLLDAIIGTRVVDKEAGGITQHIRAYQVEKDGKAISFVDTPGHEAFTEMRARGANVTDIAVLVIAADDGIMPQTEEAISHAKAAGVPIVVALNKIDLPGVDTTRVLTQLTEHELTPSEWGGDVEVVRTSALTGEGLDDLLDTVLTVAELHEYRANPDRPAIGVCLEAQQEAERGVVAKLIVKNGTLHVGDVVVCGTSYGRVKAMYDALDPSKQLEKAGPSCPANVIGLESPPEAGEKFYVLEDIAQAREIAEARFEHSRAQSLAGSSPKVSFERFQDLLVSGRLGQQEEKVELNLILRADTRGSLEAIEKELSKIDHPEVEIRILQKSVGGITVGDVTLAHASEAVIVGFNVIPDEQARALAEERHVEIRRYDIIYQLAEDIKALIEGRLKPEERIVELGRALVKQVFNISRVGTVAGCLVAQGSIQRGCRIRVHRDGRTIGDYPLESLKRHKEDVKEVPRGMECGIRLAGFNDLKPDDVLEAYKVEEVARKLD
ncbi:MAG: translation initiation factor IF-2 [Pirellulaceae bacterium]|nr:MAG: translation initiation factor IF-2 [Pirellulaceae bacterium]